MQIRDLSLVESTGLDMDGDGVLNFSSITIGANSTARFTKENWGEDALVFLVSGDVTLDGNININGSSGSTITSNPGRSPIAGGPGGFEGGLGAVNNTGTSPTAGEGPGGGNIVSNGSGGGGHADSGRVGFGVSATAGGQPYGNIFQQPIIGGSGGAGRPGSNNDNAYDGGGGGGALLLAASGTVTINGDITANGGDGGGSGSAGGGSGGGIRIVAQEITGTGSLAAIGGFTAGASTSSGRIRLEANSNSFTGSSDPLSARSFPKPVLFPEFGPVLRVTTVDGVAVSADPSGSFAMPDVTINNLEPVTIMLEAENIPVGTQISLRLVSPEGILRQTTTTPLSGSDEMSTASATVTIPSAFSRFYLSAEW